ncbi:hypothetical protein JIN85_00375 [Luteolibacter pohnpeiensis]|uniref:Uncharacterized protein n=1 Tax=Luteolibacter pohnpeiensis TaxID=454153 RepID=A0A934S4A1_9BACT|nr:hypothetical protein [Luteolibacter pohnpeiensis]MBK1880844.1 hypothetical protein [Luteolibacter pohnpeiensis]
MILLVSIVRFAKTLTDMRLPNFQNARRAIIGCIALAAGSLQAGPMEVRLAAAHDEFLVNRREAIHGLLDPFGVPEVARPVIETPRGPFHKPEDWKRHVVATVFWVGEQPSENNPTANTKSAWDPNWQANFGGYDDPLARDGYAPAGFVPQQNSFYVALPYNDLTSGGKHREEASKVIPWFWEKYRGDGISVCKGHWVEIHRGGRVCYAQWEDVGPFVVDHWQYVFGQERPRLNRNNAAGIDLSPAVRDFLGLRSGEEVEWRFVEDYEVPVGPWRR